MEERNDIVIYKSEDGLVKMDHLGRVFKSGELEADAVVKEILITAQSGARGTSDEKVRYY